MLLARIACRRFALQSAFRQCSKTYNSLPAQVKSQLATPPRLYSWTTQTTMDIESAVEPARATAGQVHALPEEEKEMPVEKKARIEVEVEENEMEAEAEAEVVEVKGKEVSVNGKGKGKVKGKRTAAEKKSLKIRRARKAGLPEACSPEDVLWKDIVTVLGLDAVDKAIADGVEFEAPFAYHEVLELEVRILGSNGDGIAVALDATRPWAVVVPLVLPGEKIRARVYRDGRMHSYGEMLEVLVPNVELRDDARVKCKYFGKCGGCQYQMLSYETQLDLKRDVVVKAYKNYSNIPSSEIPPIVSTVASPLEYAYRTKLTPHFDAPPRKAKVTPGEQPVWLQIGFNKIGTHKTLDIEECPIATPVINNALGPARETIIKNILTYKKGVSLIFRDSLDTSVPLDTSASDPPIDTLSAAFNKHICITDHKAPVRETVGAWIFEYMGGSFFQNNNAVLTPLTDYVRDAICGDVASKNTDAEKSSEKLRPTHLVDTYCGAGLFAITLSPHFMQIAGIELSADSIRSATANAALNRIPSSKISFRAGDAAAIFASVPDFPRKETAVLVDPPRKGCDVPFLEQLWAFRPSVVLYVSCNVHTQARDVGWLLQKGREEKEKGVEGGGERKGRYVLESVRGFDLFPQTAHVESVAVLRLV